MPVEDEPERLIRLLGEDRAAFVDQLVAGSVSPDNVESGYRDIVGQIKGIDRAIERVREVFRGWLPEPPGTKPQPRRIVDY